MTLRVVYAGTPEFAVPALEALAQAHDVPAVYTQPDRPAGRGQALAASPVKRTALARDLPLRQPASLRTPEAAAELAAFAPDVLLVAAYGLLLPQAVLDVPRLGCLNIHASLLPRWRGAAPIQRALLAGDVETGVCIMRMEAGLDTGPVYAREACPIDARDTAATLHDRLAAQGARLALEVLAALEGGTARAEPQPAAGVTYARKLDKREAPLDWTRPAAELDRQVRAFDPWPVAETLWRGTQLRVHAAEAHAAPSRMQDAPPAPGTVVAAGAPGVDVQTGSGLLRLTRLQLAGRRALGARDFVNAAGPGLVGARLGTSA